MNNLGIIKVKYDMILIKHNGFFFSDNTPGDQLYKEVIAIVNKK